MCQNVHVERPDDEGPRTTTDAAVPLKNRTPHSAFLHSRIPLTKALKIQTTTRCPPRMDPTISPADPLVTEFLCLYHRHTYSETYLYLKAE